LQKKDPKVSEVALAKAQARGLYPHDGWDLLVEMEELCERMARVTEERVTEAKKLAALVEVTSKVIMDIRLPPILEIP
jgi:hypothetical protein